MITWAYFPRNSPPTDFSRGIVECFEAVADSIDSEKNNAQISIAFTDAASDKVLAKVRPGLERLGFIVEQHKREIGRINVPVLFGIKGRPAKSFQADAYCEA